MQREVINIDMKKLKPEDRRFLLEKNHAELLFNAQGIMNNIAIAISALAIIISSATLIVSTDFISNNLKLFTIIFLSILAIYLIISFIVSVIKVNKQQNFLKKNYEELFKFHFEYAKRD